MGHRAPRRSKKLWERWRRVWDFFGESDRRTNPTETSCGGRAFEPQESEARGDSRGRLRRSRPRRFLHPTARSPRQEDRRALARRRVRPRVRVRGGGLLGERRGDLQGCFRWGCGFGRQDPGGGPRDCPGARRGGARGDPAHRGGRGVHAGRQGDRIGRRCRGHRGSGLCRRAPGRRGGAPGRPAGGELGPGEHRPCGGLRSRGRPDQDRGRGRAGERGAPGRPRERQRVRSGGGRVPQGVHVGCRGDSGERGGSHRGPERRGRDHRGNTLARDSDPGGRGGGREGRGSGVAARGALRRGEEWELSPEEIAQALEFEPEGER